MLQDGGKMKLRSGHMLPREGVEKILVRGTNWIGDAVMTLPALSAVRKTYPEARISALVKPWVADIYRLCPHVDEVILGSGNGVGPRDVFDLTWDSGQFCPLNWVYNEFFEGKKAVFRKNLCHLPKDTPSYSYQVAFK